MEKREIKFRAWDGDVIIPFENMLEMPLHHLNGNGMWSIMQYTGLKDKNGKEIYEGDIVKSHNIGFASPDQLCAIKYSGAGFVVYDPNCCNVCKTGYGAIANLDEYDGFEVVGNLYENPELLNKEQDVPVSDTTMVNEKQKVRTKIIY